MEFNFWTLFYKSRVYSFLWQFSSTPSCKTNDKAIKSLTGGFSHND